MRYKVRDKVRIRKDLEGDKIYGKVDMVSGMKKCLGEIAIITYVTERNYKIDIDKGNYFWSDEMFEDTESPIDKTGLDKYKELITFLSNELEGADSVRYRELLHFISVLRPDLLELFI